MYPGFIEQKKHPEDNVYHVVLLDGILLQKKLRDKCNGGLPDDEIQDVDLEDEGEVEVEDPRKKETVKGKTKIKRKLKLKMVLSLPLVK